MHRGLLALVAFLCAAWPQAAFRPARRLQLHRMRARIAAATQTPICMQGTTCAMKYFGGKVLANVKVYQVNWSGSVDSAVAGGLPGFYRAVTNSAHPDWLS